MDYGEGGGLLGWESQIDNLQLLENKMLWLVVWKVIECEDVVTDKKWKL